MSTEDTRSTPPSPSSSSSSDSSTPSTPSTPPTPSTRRSKPQLDRVRLRIDSESPTTYELTEPIIRVGTDPSCEIVIKNDRTVSAVHATFYLRDGKWCVREEGSGRGIVQVNAMGLPEGGSITGYIGLIPGKTLRLGRTTVVFERIRPEGERLIDSHGMVGTSRAMEEMRLQIEVIPTRATRVLVFGRTGVGKELVARAIHTWCQRKGRFVALNCSALSETLLENELFGHDEGGFTGADRKSPGLFRAADGGTLFLDEFGDLSISAQQKLLRALEKRSVRSVGGTTEDPVDVLVICGGQQSPNELRARGFREDFLTRLLVFSVQVPGLAERAEDIVPLVLHFTALFDGGAGFTWSLEALEYVKARRFPRNVRELRNYVEYAVAVARHTGRIDMQVLQIVERNPCFAELPDDPEGFDLSGKTLAELRIERFERALRRAGGKIGAAAADLGVNRSTVHRFLVRRRKAPQMP